MAGVRTFSRDGEFDELRLDKRHFAGGWPAVPENYFWSSLAFRK